MTGNAIARGYTRSGGGTVRFSRALGGSVALNVILALLHTAQPNTLPQSGGTCLPTRRRRAVILRFGTGGSGGWERRWRDGVQCSQRRACGVRADRPVQPADSVRTAPTTRATIPNQPFRLASDGQRIVPVSRRVSPTQQSRRCWLIASQPVAYEFRRDWVDNQFDSSTIGCGR